MIRLGSALFALILLGPAAPAAPNPDRYRGSEELARRIDRLMEAEWKKAKATPSRPADDAEWLRRVYLDLAGRIPSVTEARGFLADRRVDRRQRLVESLLAGPRFPTYFASVWRSLLLPESATNLQIRLQGPAFERWLRNWLVSGRGYDVMVRELLTTGNGPGRGRFTLDGPALFFAAKENKAEEVASAASRLFLGVNLGCAQCHNHPFASWKREQFWSFAAFFSDLPRPVRPDELGRGRTRLRRHELMIPGTEKVVKARYFDGKEPDLDETVSGRKAAADWITAADNPYFARAAVNRVWAHLFGAGLIEPLDGMAGSTESTVHLPGLLDEVSAAFVRQKYDLRWLIHTLTATRAYQLSSARSHPSQDEPGPFARMALRGLSGEQLFDSLVVATGFKDSAAFGRNPFGGGAGRQEFLTRFAAVTDRAVETQTSVLQALTLMNGEVMAAATSLRRSETLAAVADAPFMDLPQKLETLFLAALARKPSGKELSRLTAYVSRADRQGEALADVFWALLNSAEFVVNH